MVKGIEKKTNPALSLVTSYFKLITENIERLSSQQFDY